MQPLKLICPACRAEMAGNAVLCTKCGYHKEAGATLEAHKTAGVDIDHGTLALDKAAVDMERAADLQKKYAQAEPGCLGGDWRWRCSCSAAGY